MCLDFITKKYKRSVSGYGYKVFDKVSDELQFEFKYLNGMKRVPCGYWLQSSDERLYMSFSSQYYMSGFHIYLNRKDAVRHSSSIWSKVVRVRFRKGHTLGKNSGKDTGNCIIAREMFVPVQRKKSTKKKTVKLRSRTRK